MDDPFAKDVEVEDPDDDVFGDDDDDFLSGVEGEEINGEAEDEDVDDFLEFDEEDDNITGQEDHEHDISGTEVEHNADPIRSQVQYGPRVFFHSSENMQELSDEMVDLVVTSPPYNADWGYGGHDDDIDYPNEYLPMLARVFSECHRVLRPGGRLCVNVPSLLRGGASGGIPIASDITSILTGDYNRGEFESGSGLPLSKHTHDDILACQAETEFIVREQITWNKGYNDAGLAPNGSFPRPWGILLNNMHEVVVIFQKPGDRTYDDLDEETIEGSKIDKWSDDLCDDVWDISPEDREFRWAEEQDVPPFPEELVKRCITLWSYKTDTVLDPFLGSGTTCKVAKQLERHSVGYELRGELRDDIKSYIGAEQTRIF